MAQISLYMNDTDIDALRVSSQREGVSISKYVSRIVECFESGQASGWPAGYWENVYGCLDDEEAECLRAGLEAEKGALDSSLDDACDWMEA